MLDGFIATNADFQVNTGMYGEQPTPVVTGLSSGGFVVTWMDPSHQTGDMSGSGISAQLFDAAGNMVGTEFRINSETIGNQLAPAIASLDNGGFVVTWQGDNDIKGQVFDDSGAKLGAEFTANTLTAFLQSEPAVAALANGGFVISWTDEVILMGSDGYSTNRIFTQRFDALGNKAGDAVMVNYQGPAQVNSAITGLDDGGFVVAWADDGRLIHAQRFDAAGDKVGWPIRVDQNGESYRIGTEITPAITALANGNFVITWADQYTQAYVSWPGDEVRGQVFDAAGTAIYGQFVLNTTWSGGQNAPSITALDDGGFVAVWQSWESGDNARVVVQRFNFSGAKVGAETFLDYDGESNRILPQVAQTANGGFVVSWQEHVENAAGENIGIVVKATVFAPEGATEGDDSLEGTPGNDSIDGLGGNDTIDGLSGNDTLVGGDGNDRLLNGNGSSSLDGGEGDDYIWGGNGPDTLIGGAGKDSLEGIGYLDGGVGDDYFWVMGPNSTALGGEGNDFIIVDGDALQVEGGAGDDTIYADEYSSGTVIGGAGSDLIYLNAWQDIEILDFASGAGGDRLDVTTLPELGNPFMSETVALEQQGADVLVRWDLGVENWDTIAVLGNVDINALVAANFVGWTPVSRVQASEGNDTLIGSGIIDRILGLGGNDVIRGYAGNDTIDGGTGTDSLYGGAGNDTYHVDQAADKVFEVAAEGNDTVYASVTWKASDNIEAVVLTGTGNIAVYGSAQANTLTGNGGNNTLNGAEGNDTINGGDGNDKIDGGADHDVINGGAGKDSLTGGEGSDSIDGGTGNDQMNGGGRWDTLRGGEGDDILDGGLDNDAMYGGTGNDTYAVDHIGDRVYENFGEGTDTVKASISYTLTPDVENLYLIEGAFSGTGNGLVNSLNGSSLNNVLAGLGGNDSLYGWDGDDSLVGGNDHDRLSGGSGNDTLVGSHGNDNLGGGAGADDFVFSSTATNGHDHVVDFVHGLDRLVFKGSDYGFAAGHGLTAAEFTVGAAAVGTAAQFVWDVSARHLWFDADGSGAGAAIELALISGSATVTKDDLYFT